MVAVDIRFTFKNDLVKAQTDMVKAHGSNVFDVFFGNIGIKVLKVALGDNKTFVFRKHG